MSCENYKDALTEAAASGATPQGELRAHLAECASCREAFAQEQSLFAAIDDGLHTSANTEVPPSLLPRVRAAADELAVAPQRWGSSWFALAGAAAAALFFAVGIRHNNSRTPPTNIAAIRPTVEQVIATKQTPLSSAPSETKDSGPRPRLSAARNFISPRKQASGGAMPEVLVPRDQEVLLASYARQWSSRKRAPLVAGDVVQTAMAPLEVAPIQIAELDVKPLAEGNSQ
jgi:hypothetical protein